MPNHKTAGVLPANIEIPVTSSNSKDPTHPSFYAPSSSGAAAIDLKSILVPAAKEGKGGEEGVKTGSTPSSPSNAEFLHAVFGELPSGAIIAVTGKAGDPQLGGWSAHDAADIANVCPGHANTYFNCASLRVSDGEILARKEHAASYHALVLDDVGTKVARNLIAATPTWELETSPGNFQIGFKLNPPVADHGEVERMQQQIAAAGLTDKGALGMVRWARLPNGINGKPKYRTESDAPFKCRLRVWNPDTAYSATDLVKALQLKPVATSPAPIRKSSDSISSPSFAGGLYNPAAAENPVLTAFKARDLYKREISAGRHQVTCPWVAEHTDGLDTGAAYFEPDAQFPNGGFCCQHSHRDKYHIGQVLNEFGLSEAQARNKPCIRAVAGEMTGILASAEHLLAERGNIYQAGGIIVTVAEDQTPGDAHIVAMSEAGLTLALSASCDWERYDARKKEYVRCDPPQRHVSMLYKAQGYDRLPVLKGIARQPYYCPHSHKLITTAGYNASSQRLGIFNPSKFPPIVPTRTAALEALDLLQSLIAEFHFASDIDRAATLSAMFTAALRPSLGLAPAFNVTAPSSGSGKSFLCETIALFAGPGGSSRVSYPKTSEEATKSILSLLLTSPAVIEFDDMDTDWLPHGAINRMLTSESITDRILGVSKVATVGTASLVLGSGNNVGPLRDLARRVLTINLNARSETPGTLAYKGNPIASLKADRERYIHAVLTIVEAWKAAGSPRAIVPSIASYGGHWSDYCRHALLWLGLPDPASTLLNQMQSDPDADVLHRFMEAWHEAHGNSPITIRRLLDDIYGSDLLDAILDLPVIDRGNINRSRLGHYLRRNRDKIVKGLVIQKVDSAERNAWRVVKVADPEVAAQTPASPPSPPSPASPPATADEHGAAGPEAIF